MKIISNEQLESAQKLAAKYGKLAYLQKYAEVPKQRCIMFSDESMDLDDKHRVPSSRDERGMLITEYKHIIAYFPRRKNKYVIVTLFWNDQMYPEYWNEGENGYWDCINICCEESETFEEILQKIERRFARKS